MIRDMKTNEPNTSILDLLNFYNNISHQSLNYKYPNEIADEDEL